MKEELRPAIDALVSEIEAMERKASETKGMVNRLCELAGAAPIYADVNVPERRGVTTLRADQFYGRVLTTAMREYLEMRDATNLGPATPREIYQALAEGGFKFETRNEDNAITNIRATLRKNSSIFHRLPNSEYGLLAWYPNAKTARQDDEGEDSARNSRPRSTRRKGSRAAGRPKVSAKKIPYGSIAMDLLADGNHWTTDQMKAEAIKRGVPGIDENTNKLGFQGALLSLKKQGKVTSSERGWKVAPDKGGNSGTVVELKGAA